MSSSFVVADGKLLLKTSRASRSESTASTGFIRFPTARQASQTPSDIAPKLLKRSAVRTSVVVSSCVGQLQDRKKIWSASFASAGALKSVLRRRFSRWNAVVCESRLRILTVR